MVRPDQEHQDLDLLIAWLRHCTWDLNNMLKVKNNPIYMAVIDFSVSKCIRAKITSCSDWNEKLNEINASETRKRRIWGQSFTAHLISHTMWYFASWSSVSSASCNEQCNGPLVGLFACLERFFVGNGLLPNDIKESIDHLFFLFLFFYFLLYYSFLSKSFLCFYLSQDSLALQTFYINYVCFCWNC